MAETSLSSPHPLTPPRSEEIWVAWLRLLRSRRVGPTTFHRLMAEHGSAEAALAALPEVARGAGVENYTPCPIERAEAEWLAARHAGARPVAFGSPEYPAGLSDLPDAPPVLWTLGDLALLSRPMVALVGARNASSLGTRMARRLADGLGEAGFVVVSGLARGVDTAAHLASLERGTCAVMAGGVDVVYPAENAVLAQEIAEKGLRISEQPVGLVPQARHFPARNRIISALARAVVVVEAAAKSGSLITARDALDLGRDVLAVPGHPFDARASGCNMLIRDGARLVRGVDDVIEAIGAVEAEPALPLETHDAVAAGAEKRKTPSPTAAAPTEAAGRIAALHAAAIERDRETTRAISDKADTLRNRDSRRAGSPQTGAAGGAGRNLPDTRALHAQILARLGPSPLAEDQLIRDLALPAHAVTPELVTLELDGRITRQPGGLIALN